MDIKVILEDIKNSYKEKPEELYNRLVQERLNKALKSYYNDISNRADTIENSIDDKKILKVVKRVTK